MKITDIKPEMFERAARIEKDIRVVFDRIDEIAQKNTIRVMSAFQDQRVNEACFAGTTGYGYDDFGREVLDKVYAQVFGAEAANVRIQFVNGTHTISTALFAAVKPGDTLMSVTGLPYDTMRNVIGITGDEYGSLKFYGVNYDQVDLAPNGEPDYDGIFAAVSEKKPAAVLIQRSRGYEERKSLSIDEIGRIIDAVKRANPETVTVVDNCYGEFTEDREPCHVGADIIAGSLIKNPGGGIAPTGGYIAGRKDLIEKCSFRLTCAGVGREVGATLGHSRELYLGLFSAPHVVGEALKTAVYASALFSALGYTVSPETYEKRGDIIQCVTLNTAQNLVAFCQGMQSGAPVDSFVVPEPWDMPGYTDPVIMAAGAFTLGASIELSADGPLRPPFAAWMQGGLNFHSAHAGVLLAAQKMLTTLKEN